MTDVHAETVAALAARLEALEARTRSLEAENERLRATVRTAASTAPAARPDTTEAAPIGRRAALGKGLAAAAGVAAGAVLADAAPAAAANGGTFVLGQGNQATSQTTLGVVGTAAPYGLGVLDNNLADYANRPALLASVRGSGYNHDTGLYIDSWRAGIIMAMSSSAVVGLQLNMDANSTCDAILVNGGKGRGIRAFSNTAAAADIESKSSSAAMYVTNSGSGYALGLSASGSGGNGLLSSVKAGLAVQGNATIGVGVQGIGSETGVDGWATGTGSTGTGVIARSDNALGLRATGKTGAVYAEHTGTSGFAGEFRTSTGTAVKAVGKVFGVIAQSLTTNPDEAAMAASSIDGLGIYANSDTGDVMRGLSSSGGGVSLDAPKFHLRLTNSESRGAPTGDTFAHKAGDLVETSSGELWVCTGSGTPGNWRKLAGPTTAGAFHALTTPARVYDSRPGSTPTSIGPKTPFGTNTTRTFSLGANSSGVPNGASAVMVNLLLVNAAAGNGNATIWAQGATKPVANTIVWGGSSGRFSTLAVTRVDGFARCQVNTSLATDLIIDVIGYYR